MDGSPRIREKPTRPVEREWRTRNQIHDSVLPFAGFLVSLSRRLTTNLGALWYGRERPDARLPDECLPRASGFPLPSRRAGGRPRRASCTHSHRRGRRPCLRSRRIQSATVGVGRERLLAVADNLRSSAWWFPVSSCRDCADPEAERVRRCVGTDVLSFAARLERNATVLALVVSRKGPLWYGRVHDDTTPRLGGDDVAGH